MQEENKKEMRDELETICDLLGEFSEKYGKKYVSLYALDRRVSADLSVDDIDRDLC